LHTLQTLVRQARSAVTVRRGRRQCFTDVADDTVVALAESFWLENCVRRERLAGILAASAAGQAERWLRGCGAA
jgi:hypothetical protein